MDKTKIAEYRNESSSRLSGAGTYYSEPPFRVDAFPSEIIDGYVKNWGNADNYIKATVMWGLANEGEYPFEHGTTPTSTTLNFIEDKELVFYISAGATPANQVNFRFMIPEIRGMFRKVKLELVGTSAQADIEMYSLPKYK